MKSIAEILDLAISSPDALPTAMLHCKVLADELDYAPLQDWLSKEINGYTTKAEIPTYRQTRGRLKGDFHQDFTYRGIQEVPREALGPDLVGIVETVLFSQGVGQLSKFPDDGSLAFNVGMQREILNLINLQLGIHGKFTSLRLDCPPGAIGVVLISIQHRLVTFLSEMKQLFREARDVSTPTPREFAEVDRSFDRNINIEHASHVYLSPGNVHIDQSNTVFQQIHVGNWPEFEAFLANEKIPAPKRQEVKAILEKLDEEGPSEDVEGELKSWVEETAEDLTEGLGGVVKEATKKAATDTLVEGLKKYAPEVVRWGWVIAKSLM